jgi:hypothetical protein
VGGASTRATVMKLIRLSAPWMLLVLIALTAAWLRYGFVQSPEIAHQCGSGGPSWCGFHRYIVVFVNNNGFGIAAALAAALALIWHHTYSAWLAGVLGVVALTLYNYEPGALALMIGSLRLIREQARLLTVGERNGEGNGKINHQP